ncbi:MAG: shikimate dehydrogenase family protein [Candidatus Cryptobacteroides sp.]
MQRFGLLGYPIAHSLSPALFEAGYDGRYAYDLVEQEDFDIAWRTFLRRYQAVNVTAPFKEMAFGKAKLRSRECELIGAANILVQTPKGVSAWNSDCTGVAALLRKAFGGERFLEGLRTLVVGAGGAGKAAAVAALSCGMTVSMINRSLQRALEFSHRLAQSSRILTVLPADQLFKAFAQSDVVIYTASAPLWTGLPPTPFADGPEILVEANYRNPSFSAEVLSRICPRTRLIPGEEWLLMQAVTGYSLMTGRNPDSAAMAAVLK